jgi:hypothetical protein
MELGVVHDFVELADFVAAVRALLKPDGTMVLNEFHPLIKKSIDVTSGKVEFAGDYFASEPEGAPTPYGEFTDVVVPTSSFADGTLGRLSRRSHQAASEFSACSNIPRGSSINYRARSPCWQLPVRI